MIAVCRDRSREIRCKAESSLRRKSVACCSVDKVALGGVDPTRGEGAKRCSWNGSRRCKGRRDK